MAESLEEIDADGDGSITLEEFETRMQSRFGGRGRGGQSGGAQSEPDDQGPDAGGGEDPDEESPDRPQRPESEE